MSPFLSVDAVFVLCYSIIMLATNLHNVNIKAKDRMQASPPPPPGSGQSAGEGKYVRR